jgi:large subunit ribosomal protein L9
MKVILLKPVEKLGKTFDIVDVSSGYARNYLMPRKLAMPATKANVRGLEKTKKRFSKTIERVRVQSMGLVDQITNATIKTTLKIGIDGKAFGSITSANLTDLLKEQGIAVDKKHIVLEEPIKQPGVYDVKVHLGENIDAILKVVVLEEGEK